MAETEPVGKRVTFDPATLERATSAAKERGMTLNRLVGLALEDFCGRLLPAEQIQWTRSEPTRDSSSSGLPPGMSAQQFEIIDPQGKA